jgi:anti-sigma factor (TIGR02949 family)
MTGCPEREMALQALADGELDAMATVALEEHLRGCAGCRGELETLETLRSVLRDPALREAAPEQLRARVMAQIPRPAPARPGWVAWTGGALGGALAASLALMLAMPQAAVPGVADELVDSHIRSLQGAHLIDVQTSDRHVVKPWFNGRIDYAPPVPDLKDQGFPLVGGRLDVVAGRSVAVLVYKRRLHTINLFVRPAGATAPASGERHGSYGLVHWAAGGLDYWAVSDLELGDLEQFRAAFAGATGG